MKWREWPAWLKGGIIGFILSFISLYALGILGLFLFIPFLFVVSLVAYLTAPSFGDLFYHSAGGYPQPTGFGVVGYFIFYLLIGALIGWAIGKMRAQK